MRLEMYWAGGSGKTSLPFAVLITISQTLAADRKISLFPSVIFYFVLRESNGSSVFLQRNVWVSISTFIDQIRGVGHRIRA
jgi:hypothetical protein